MKKRADNSCARVKRTRTRSGCLTCRKRHMKCDERVPVCQKCSKSKRTCVWGILAKYTNFTCYDPSSNGSWNSSLVSSFSRIIDQSFAVAKLYKDGPVLFKECRRGHTQEELAEAERILQQDLWAGKAPVSYKASPEFIHERETLDPSLTVPGVDNKNGFSPGDLQFLEAWKTMGMGMGVPEAVRCESPATWFRSPKHPEIKRIPVIAQPHDMQQGCVTRLIGAIPLGGADHFSSPTQLGSSVHARFAQRLTPELGVSSPLSPVQNRGPLFTGGTPPEFRLVQNDAEKYINIVRVQKYFWMLDLFNDLRVWETCIPNFCVRLNQASNLEGHSSTSDETFLFNCILLCDENSSIDRVLEMCSWQLHMWQEFDMKEVELSSYAAFEKVLISVVFISLSMLIKSTQSGFFVSPTINKILANQGRLIHKLIAQYSRFPGTCRQKLGSTVFTEASFQAIIILRFFLKKTFQKLGVDYNPRDSSTYQAFSYDITYSDTMMHDTANFFTLTEQEVSFLCNDHNSFLELQNDACSDAGQLCKTFWEMIIAEYRIDTRDRRMLPSPDSDLVPSETTLYPTIVSALLPNSRCLAISLCKAYQNKILGDNQMAVSPREIFNRIAAVI